MDSIDHWFGFEPLRSAGAVVAWSEDAVDDGWVFLSEREASASWGRSRRMEFTTGRTLARTALAHLGWSPCPIPRSAGGGPIWPAGVSGSITHTSGLCVVIVARRSSVLRLGVDIERSLVEGASVEVVVGPDDSWPAAAGSLGPMLVLSMKESVIKAVSGSGGSMLDFADITVRASPDGRFTVSPASVSQASHALRGLRGRWRTVGGLVVTAAFELVAGSLG